MQLETPPGLPKNFWKHIFIIFLNIYLSTKKIKSESERGSAVTAKDAPPTPPPPAVTAKSAERGGGGVGERGLGGFRALRRHGWGWGVGGAPFAVTAEPRSLSLFIFLVDEQILKMNISFYIFYVLAGLEEIQKLCFSNFSDPCGARKTEKTKN